MDENRKNQTYCAEQADKVSFISIYIFGICHRIILLGDLCILSEYGAEHNQYQSRDKRTD